MELSSSNIKKIYYISTISGNRNPPQKRFCTSINENPKKASYISRNETQHFSAQSPKISYILGNGNC